MEQSECLVRTFEIINYFDWYLNILHIRTIFTGLDRYNYVDPDYAYTDKEQEKYERHKQIYKQYLKSLKYNRFEKIRKE